MSYNSVVESVEVDGTRVRVKDQSGQVFEADKVCTIQYIHSSMNHCGLLVEPLWSAVKPPEL